MHTYTTLFDMIEMATNDTVDGSLFGAAWVFRRAAAHAKALGENECAVWCAAQAALCT